MRKSTWRARLSGVLASVFLVGLLPTVILAADNDPITRAGLAEKIYANDSLKMLIGDDTTEAGFNDIDNCTEDQKKAINALANAGIISGTSADTFSPSKTVTRAEVAVVLWRATGCKSNETASTVVFDDVHIGDWYAPAIQALSAAGIITGTQDEKFNPTETITEQQVSTLISRYASSGMNRWQTGTTRLEMLMETYEKYKDSPVLQAKAEAGSEIDYADISDCTPEQKTAIQFFTKAGIVQGYNETPAAFHPYAAASSVQIAVFLKMCIRDRSAVCEVIFNNLMHNDGVGLDAEDRVAEFHGTDFCAGHVQNFDRRHSLSTPFLLVSGGGLLRVAAGGLLRVLADVGASLLDLVDLDSALDGHKTALGAGNRAADHQHVQLGVHLDNLQVLHSHLLNAHVTRAIAPLHNAAGSRARAQGTLMAVDGAAAVGVALHRGAVALDNALVAVALAHTGHIHKVAGLESVSLDQVADIQLGGIFQVELPQVLLRGNAGLVQVAHLRPVSYTHLQRGGWDWWCG